MLRAGLGKMGQKCYQKQSMAGYPANTTEILSEIWSDLVWFRGLIQLRFFIYGAIRHTVW